jgi:hypothetical protein
MNQNDKRIDLIEKIEIEMGFTKNGNPRTMFRPYRVGGGVCIRQAVKWGHGEVGYKSSFIPNEYKQKGEQCSLFEGASDSAYDLDSKEGKQHLKQCDGGFCGQ